MSKYTTSDGLLDYGFDHALGYFYTKYAEKDDVESVIEEGSSTFGTSRGVILRKMKKSGAPREHQRAIVLDLPF